MTIGTPYLVLRRLRILCGSEAVYDEAFHEGVNIIRGQNGSGKSTIADFIFFVLGGEFEDWKEAAGLCEEVQAEVETPRGKLTLRRRVAKSQEPMLVYFGSMADGLESTIERWERFPIRRQAGRESFSQVLFRSLLIPEAQSEGAANITMHQLLRLCYSDQRTPAWRLFRLESFDTQGIREAVGDLVCGINGYELYQVGLEIRELERDLAGVVARLEGLQSALPNDGTLNTPELIEASVERLREEAASLRSEIAGVDEIVEAGAVTEYLAERRQLQAALSSEREAIRQRELTEKELEFELREIGEFVTFLGELTEKVGFAEAAFESFGSIDFTHCPACGQEIRGDTDRSHCVVCKSPVDSEGDMATYNQIRLDLEIQARESRQLVEQKSGERRSAQQQLRKLRREHEQNLSEFELRFAGGNGPRDGFLAPRISRLGRIEAEIDHQLRGLDLAAEVAELTARRVSLAGRIEELNGRASALEHAAGIRRPRALGLISDLAASMLREDMERQAEFLGAGRVEVDFRDDSIAVDESVNFAESSNVFLKNTTIVGLLLAAGQDEKFYHPRFVLIDNIEDKGMEVDRSHLFQRLIVERVTEIGRPYQLIYTTSMMNPELELEDYTVGPAYTSEQRSLRMVV